MPGNICYRDDCSMVPERTFQSCPLTKGAFVNALWMYAIVIPSDTASGSRLCDPHHWLVQRIDWTTGPHRPRRSERCHGSIGKYRNVGIGWGRGAPKGHTGASDPRAAKQR